MISTRLGAIGWVSSLLLGLLSACAKTDDEVGSGGGGGNGATGGEGGEGGEDIEVPVDPLCQQFCDRAAANCQGCQDTDLQACSQSFLTECGAQNRAVAECYVSDAATVTCDDGLIGVVGCEERTLELRKCLSPGDWCESALDGSCDEPDPCEPGSDTTDCSGS